LKIIVTAASKGGVGKSLISLTTAYALKGMGFKTGLLDTDISMPAIVKYLGLEGVEIQTHRLVEPIDHGGVQVLSAGLLMDKDQPVVIQTEKREALVGQFIDRTNWDVDYLVIDTPPGATDELQHILRTRKADLKGVIVVTTPSSVAITEVRRSLEMFRRMKVPVLGLIGNMTSYECESCHYVTGMFKNGVVNPIEIVAHDFNLKVLTELPVYSGIDTDPLHFVNNVMGGLKLVKL
jgi:ATP-binding protein involved in chromosome partitioning